MRPIQNVIVILSLIFFCSCHSNIDDIQIIDYEQLDDIQIGIVMEIGDDSENNEYVVGRLGDLVLMSDGTFFVSDFGKLSVEQFNIEGKHVASIAREGEGPGELPSFFKIIDAGADTLAVWDEHKRQIDYFGSEAEDSSYGYLRSEQSFSNQRLDLIGSNSGIIFYAYSGLSDAEYITADAPDYRQTPIAIVDKSLNILRDSIQVVKTANPIFGDPAKFSAPIIMNNLAYLGMPPYRYQDRFVLMKDGRYLIARPDNGVLYIYNDSNDHEPDKRIFLSVKARQVQTVDLNFLLKIQPIGNDNRTRRELENRTSELKPPFLNVWVSEDSLWLHVDTNERGKQIVALTMEGEAVGQFYLSEYDDIRYFRDDRIYTLHKDPDIGHSIRIYQVNI